MFLIWNVFFYWRVDCFLDVLANLYVSGALVFLLYVVVCVWGLYLLSLYSAFFFFFGLLFVYVLFLFLFCSFFLLSFFPSLFGVFFLHCSFFLFRIFLGFPSSFLQFFPHTSFKNDCVSIGQSSLISVISSWSCSWCLVL